MSDDPVPVFVSYHSPDYALAYAIKTSLEKLSPRFQVFLDKTTIAPGDDFRSVIAEALSKAQWLLIVCTGFPRPDADMAWSFFEAGQFSATLPPELASHAEKRMVCLYDREAPSILAPLNGVKISEKQKSGAQIDMSMMPVRENNQLDETYIYSLFKAMLDNKPLVSIRDTRELSVKGDMREESHAAIQMFEGAVSTYPISDRALQPRVSYELNPDSFLQPDTKVKGYNSSLETLFSIMSDETTWAEIVAASRPAIDDPIPMWVRDIEHASIEISNGRAPKVVATKCTLKETIYRVFTSRYELFKTKRRTVYVTFLPAVARHFDLRHSTGTLLSALILSVRFREQLFPMMIDLSEESTNKTEVLIDFYRLLQSIEMEAIQFGLGGSTDDADDSRLVAVIRDDERRNVVRNGMIRWSKKRAEIAIMFSPSNNSNEKSVEHAIMLLSILEDVKADNAAFVSALSQELMEQI